MSICDDFASFCIMPVFGHLAMPMGEAMLVWRLQTSETPGQHRDSKAVATSETCMLDRSRVCVRWLHVFCCILCIMLKSGTSLMRGSAEVVAADILGSIATRRQLFSPVISKKSTLGHSRV